MSVALGQVSREDLCARWIKVAEQLKSADVRLTLGRLAAGDCGMDALGLVWFRYCRASDERRAGMALLTFTKGPAKAGKGRTGMPSVFPLPLLVESEVMVELLNYLDKSGTSRGAAA